MQTRLQITSHNGTCHRLIRAWLAVTRRKIRTLQAGEIITAVPSLFAVSHPAGFFQAVVLSMAIDRPIRCLLPRSFVDGSVARYVALRLGMILYDGEQSLSEEAQREAVDALRNGVVVVVFADQNAAGQSVAGTLGRTVALVVGRAEAQPSGRRIAVYPVHLFLSQSPVLSREILIYVDSVLASRGDWRVAPSSAMDAPAFITALESRFQENAFQLRPPDLEFFLRDLEEVLQASLKEDWASRPDWKQDTEGFVLSRLVTDWVEQMNYINPGRLVSWRKSLDDYVRLQRRCALREMELEGVDSPLASGERRPLFWFESILGLPIALYGLLNHLAIGLVLFLAGSFQRDRSRPRSVEVTIWVTVTLAFYALQTFLVAHRWGRVAAGYYAPSLPVSGLYLWRRYAELMRPRARLLFMSITNPGLKRKIIRLRRTLLEEMDRTLSSYEETVTE